MVNSNDFIGLTKKTAQNKAEQMNLIFRLIRIDDEKFLDYPADHRDDRLCVELDKGVVTTAAIK